MEALQVTWDISTRAGLAASQLSDCESRVREVERREAAVAVKTKELEDREAVMVTRETAASAAISASDSLRTQLEAAQKAREKAEGDLEKLKKERADEVSVRVELRRLGLQL